MKTETLEAIGAAGNKATIIGGSVAIAGKLSAADLAAYIGAAVAVIGLLITWYYKREANKRQAADETLSARCYRAHRDGKILGKLFMRPIDLLFFWQGAGHCRNAYIKEFERKNYPSEYRAGAPIFESRGGAH